MFTWFKGGRRRRVRETDFPEGWREVLRCHFPHYLRLSAEDRKELEGHIQVFLAEKRFEGCGGIEITDEIRVTIAAAACLLLLHRETDYYPGLKTVLVYPHTFVYKGTRREGALEHEEESELLGQAWSVGAVVLAWNSVTGGCQNVFDGRNVAFHEFAHLLDLEDGEMDGSPRHGPDLGRKERNARYAAWARICQKEYESLQRQVERGKQTVIDEYGATDPAEFFAEITECFFEKPRQLRKSHPELYEELKKFYKQNPEEWGG